MRRPRPPERREYRRQQPPHPATEVEAIILDYMPKGYYADPHREHRNGPVAQALGLRSFLLLDGIPLEPVEPLEYVTLAREVVRSVPVPDAGGRPRLVRVSLACIPGATKNIYCYPFTTRNPAVVRAVIETVEAEDPRVMVLTDLEALKSVARERGLPEKILVVPRTPITYNDLSDFAKENLRDAVRKVLRDHEDLFVEFFNIAEPINIRLHSLSLLKGVGKKTLIQLLREREKRPFKSYEEVRKIIKTDPVESLEEKILEEIRGEAKYYLFVPPPDSREPFLNYLEKMRRAMRKKRHETASL
jgi:putative nucleotide binding protein